MQTAMVSGQATPTGKLMRYSELFRTDAPKREQIIVAAGRLATALGQVLTAPMLEIWAENLEPFSQEALVQAFSMAEKTLEAWPTPAKILGLLFDVELRDDYSWLAINIKKHGAEWKPSEPVLSEYMRVNQDENPRMERTVIEPGEPAPEISPRLVRTLELLSGEDYRAGLAIFAARPSRKITSETGWSVPPNRQWFDSSFRSAWMQARNEELAQ